MKHTNSIILILSLYTTSIIAFNDELNVYKVGLFNTLPNGQDWQPDQSTLLIYFQKLVQSFGKEENLRNKLLRNVSDECAGHTSEWLSQLGRIVNFSALPDPWSIKMADAFGKIPEGILSGHINIIGDFDECVGIRATNVKFSNSVSQQYPNLSSNFRGKYCNMYVLPSRGLNMHSDLFGQKVAQLNTFSQGETVMTLEELIAPPVFMMPSIGTCLPSSCSIDDSQMLVKNILNLLFNITVATIPMNCQTDESFNFDIADILMIIILSTLLMLAVVAGVMDAWIQRRGKTNNPNRLLWKCFYAFSLHKNVQKLLKTDTAGDSIGCLHGIRFLTFAWILLAHCFAQMGGYSSFPNWNMVDLKVLYKDWTTLTIFHAAPSVDTFFLISGLLVSYNLLKYLDKTKGKFNLPMFYIHRYLRLTPAYAILIGILATIYPYMGSGPYWGNAEHISNKCKQNWWQNLLYINNLVAYGVDTCVPLSWYLSTDMQFYLVSPILIYPIWRWRSFGLSLLAASTVGAILCPIALITIYQTTPTFIATRDNGEMLSWSVKPYMKIQPYLVGILVGYILYRTKGRRVTLSKIAVFLGWTISIVTIPLIVYGIHPWFYPTTKISPVEAALFGGFFHLAWAGAISWIILSCLNGYGGIANDILSWAPFIPLGKLSYCAYLYSQIVQTQIPYTTRQAVTYRPFDKTHQFFGDFVSTLVVAFACSMIFEVPFVNLTNLLNEKDRGKPEVKRNIALPVLQNQ